jgi:hypothetical protein
MSNLAGVRRSYHVFTRDGDVYIDHGTDGDLMLRSLVVQYPDATVIPKDRDTGQALGRELPLVRLLWLLRRRVRLSPEIQEV